MAIVTNVHAEISTSIEVKGHWFRAAFGIDVEPEPGDDVSKIKKTAWNTCTKEVEAQIADYLKELGDNRAG